MGGAEVNTVDCVGQTPLFYAVSHVQADQIVPLLLQAGSAINQARWSDEWTALHIAAMMGLERIVDLLLAAGADPAMKTSEGFTAAKVEGQNTEIRQVKDQKRETN